MKLLMKLLIGIVVMVTSFVLISNIWIIVSTQEQINPNRKLSGSYPIAIVLGTSRLTVNGDKNPFFEARMNAAGDLYWHHNVKQLLVSGDNESKYYNEPRDMTNALIDRGIPDSVIIRDASGLRTLDSMVRLKEVYGQDTVLVVTQAFHAYRALFIANYYGLVAQAYLADSPEDRGMAVYIREFMARPLAIIDLYLLNRQPKYPAKSQDQ